MAEELWKEVSADLAKFIPAADAGFEKDFAQLGDTSLSLNEFISIIFKLIHYLQRN